MKPYKAYCVGTVPGKRYTREEGVRLLCDFQDEIIRDYRARFSGALTNRKYFTKNLEMTADGYRLGAEPEFQDLKTGLDKVSETIAAWRTGLIAEERAVRAFSRTLPGEEMEVLFGVSLRDGKERTEYDAVAITPYGLFIIEVKSYSQPMTWDAKGLIMPTAGAKGLIMPTAGAEGLIMPTAGAEGLIMPIAGGGAIKNLGEQMKCKEVLMRRKLRRYKNLPHYSILLVADNRAEISDDYKRIPVSCLNTILGDIRSHSDGTRHITTEDIRAIKEILMRSTAPVLVPCPVDCKKIAEEYSWFVGACADKDNQSVWKRIRGMLGGALERKLAGAPAEKEVEI